MTKGEAVAELVRAIRHAAMEDDAVHDAVQAFALCGLRVESLALGIDIVLKPAVCNSPSAGAAAQPEIRSETESDDAFLKMLRIGPCGSTGRPPE